MTALHLAPCSATCSTAAADRRSRAATLVPTCSAPAAGGARNQPRQPCRQRHSDTCCAAARDAGIQSFPQPGETMDFPPDELPRQSEEAQLATVPRPGLPAAVALSQTLFPWSFTNIARYSWSGLFSHAHLGYLHRSHTGVAATRGFNCGTVSRHISCGR
jgi:hypothetical protein